MSGGAVQAESILAGPILDHARRRPSAPALVWGDRRVGYGLLADMAGHACATIAGLDLPPGAPVGIVARKSPEAIALVLGTLMAGRPFLLPSVDLGAETLRILLDDAGCRAVLSTDAPGDVPFGHLVTCVVGPPPAVPAPRPPAAPAADRTTFMLTTSGSTGLPKIVPLRSSAVDRFTDWALAAFGIGPQTGVLSYAPLNFDLSLLDVWATLKAGGCVVLVDQERATSARHLVDVLSRDDVHVLQAVPMLYHLLVEATRDDARSFDSVRHVVSTGGSLARRTLAQLPALFPRARIHNLYGCTETNDSFVCELDAEVVRRPGPLPIGAPLPDVSALVVADDGTVVTGAGTGELWVSTPFQTDGYLGSHAGSGKFVQCPGGDNSRRYFRTGDLVQRHADGTTTLVGRNDFQVKVRGVAVNLEEVERALLDHDGILEAAVVAIPDDVAGNRLHALVRCRPGAGPNSLALRQFCAVRLPRAALPSAIAMTAEPLPRTSTGKLDRRRIASP